MTSGPTPRGASQTPSGTNSRNRNPSKPHVHKLGTVINKRKRHKSRRRSKAPPSSTTSGTNQHPRNTNPTIFVKSKPEPCRSPQTTSSLPTTTMTYTRMYESSPHPPTCSYLFHPSPLYHVWHLKHLCRWHRVRGLATSMVVRAGGVSLGSNLAPFPYSLHHELSPENYKGRTSVDTRPRG